MGDELTRAGEFVRQVVKPAVYPSRLSLEVAAHHLHGEPIPPSEAVRRQYGPFAVGDAWGGMWDTTWFRFTASVPDEW